MRQSEQSAWDRVIAPWWAKVVGGVIVILLGILTYDDLAKLESGERKHLWIGGLTEVLYDRRQVARRRRARRSGGGGGRVGARSALARQGDRGGGCRA